MSAAGTIFLNTNVLVYAHDRSEAVKGPLASSVLNRIAAAGPPLISIQVLSEFYWTATRKIPAKLTDGQARAEIQRFRALAQIVPLDWSLFDRALQIVNRHGIPLWDAQILAAAAIRGATHVLSEDFQHGQTLEGVTFLNPFDPGFDLSSLSIP
jgi:predicted nucleic acid-binding protein